MSDDQNPTSAQIRGDIQRGRTGDKRPGFDPAMAPLETDSEAGGSPYTREDIVTARKTQSQPGVQQTSRNFEVAMGSSLEGTYKRRLSLPAVLPLIAVIVIGGAVVLGAWLR